MAARRERRTLPGGDLLGPPERRPEDDRREDGRARDGRPGPHLPDDDETLESLAPKLDAAAGELLPVVFERLARGDRGDPQEGGDYQSWFEDEYRFVDVRQPAAAVHNQVRAWRFTPPLPDRGAILDRDGRQIRLLSTSLSEVDGGERLDCADGPLWILESEPV